MPSRNVTPKQPKASVLRAKRKREPQVHENAKTAIIIKGRKTSQNVTDALKDLVSDTASHSQQARALPIPPWNVAFGFEAYRSRLPEERKR